MGDKKEKKITFYVDIETHDRVKALPRSFNLSGELRNALDKILKKAEEIT
jgi:hypothetical protein